MVITKLIKLTPSVEQNALIDATMREFISLTNDILNYSIAIDSFPSLTSASVNASLPSALKNQCIQDAKSIWKKSFKLEGHFPELKKPVAVWNNQNYKVLSDAIEFPVMRDGKSKRIHVKASIPADVLELLQASKLGSLRITFKGKKLIAQIAHETPETVSIAGGTMGVDLGIKCPAVARTDDGQVKFFGNGRRNKYIRRRHKVSRRKLGKAKKLNAIRKSHDKEQRWMRDQDHKVSRAIVNYASTHGIRTIKMEALSGIRSTTRTSRKNNYGLHTWSFYRVSQYIEYKAKLAGIDVVYVNPAYTSQRCPSCGALNKAHDRSYSCECGFHLHRDIVGAVNILAA